MPNILMKIDDGPSAACRLGASLLVCLAAFALATGHVRAGSADLALCDRVAADPADPDKPADVQGVTAVAPSDVAAAIKYCRIASAASRRALYQLGRAYAAGQQMPEALGAYRKAADKGSTAAMIELGLSFASGSGTPKDLEQARTLFARAAAAGNPRGATNLAALSALSGGGTSSDLTEARALLARAAETNSAEAQYQLGFMNAQGIGGPRDDVAARGWFEKAAAQGHPEALDWMGNFAETGRGGPKDSAMAKTYYEKAAALGNEDAKAALERLKCPYVVKDKHGDVVTHLCF
jgi:uncharacterized protein